MRALGLVAALLCSSPAFAYDARAQFYLKDGDRVVFYGDSITEQRLYTTYIEAFVLTRFPDLKVSFINSGWGGDSVSGGGGGSLKQRLERDVLAYKPTVVTVMLGMNDAGYRPFDQKRFESYAAGLKNLVDSLRAAAPAIRITLLAPSPFDDLTRPATIDGGNNAVLVKYGDFVKELAREDGLEFADMNAPVLDLIGRAWADDPDLAARLIEDRVHPSKGVHLAMAAALLKAWQAPVLVSDVELELSPLRASTTWNAEVTDLARTKTGLKWTQADGSLPMPFGGVDPIVSLAIRNSDFVDSLDLLRLRVAGLRPGSYTLKIDGKDSRSCSQEDLAGGVNISGVQSPMRAQAESLYGLIARHVFLHYVRWRLVQTTFEGLDLSEEKPTLDQMDKLEAQLVDRERAAAVPKAHRFELVREIK